MKRCFSSLLVLTFLFLGGCGAPGVGDTGAVRQIFAMDTVMSLTVHGAAGEAAVEAAVEEINALELLLSRTRADSQVARLNAHAGDGAWQEVDGGVAGLLRFAQSVGAALPGSFDITIAPVLDAWGFTKEERRVPSPAALADALSRVDGARLSVDEAAGAARLEEAGMAVDLGAVAKGYAAARATRAILDAGADSALLDLGGNVTALGTKPDGAAWRVAVKDPRDTDEYFGILTLEDRTASTSGGYERYFEEGGVVYHHIIDPKTGYPADTGLLSVTVVSADPLLADALSTALFVAGPEAALDFWRDSGDFELLLCRADGTVTLTEGLEDTFQFRGEERGYTYEIARR